MKKNLSSCILLICTLFLLIGCSSKDTDPAALSASAYPPTTNVKYIYQAAQAASSCRVFAELLVTFPAELNGVLMREQLGREAKKRGADMVLIGQSRRMEDNEGTSFVYYGPQKEYLCNEQWCGWKYGYDIWEEQGEFVNIGFKEWGNPDVRFEYPVMLQAAFLRCQK